MIENKLESMRRCVARIEATCPATAGEFATNLDAQDIVSLNLTRSVQLAVDVGLCLLAGMEVPAPATMGETFSALGQAGVLSSELAARLRGAVGFRNIAVHSYQAIDWSVVHGLCARRLDDFRDFARAVTVALDGRSGP